MADKKEPTRTDLSTAAEREGTTTLQEATEKGYLGTVMDDTPNEDYTVAGRISAGEMETQEDTMTQETPTKSTAKKAST